jgi:hypothetical protein
MQTATVPRLATPTPRPNSWSKYFYLFMSFVTVAVVFYGFHFTVEKNLIHPSVPKPFLLYVHAVVFTTWLAFFVFQSVLVRTRNVQWHRLMGWAGLALGISVFVVGLSTTLVMARFNRDVLHQKDAEIFTLVPLFDMLCFGTAFTLAVLWRKKPELHRRLILIATCALTAAGWGRFPILPPGAFYLGVDVLILMGIARDWFVDHRIHKVYKYALPAIAVGQAVVITTIVRQSPTWLRLAHKLIG